MTIDHPGRFALLRGSLLEVPQDQPLRLGCDAGELWITQDNDVRDVVLRPGEQFATDPARRVLVSALEDSVLEVRVTRAAPRAGWRAALQAA